jgi:hypothetical protein
MTDLNCELQDTTRLNITNKKQWIEHTTIIYGSDGQLAARGLIYSGPRQVTGLFSQNLNFTTAMA